MTPQPLAAGPPILAAIAGAQPAQGETTPADARGEPPAQTVVATEGRAGREPIVIAHRGASAYRPEHTLAAYALAIDQGADFIEPDLVPTRDGVLVARHENALSSTTDVADRVEFAARRTTKTIDGESVTDWFTEDFTVTELKSLRARERIPEIRPANTRFDGRFDVPTLAEIIDLVRRAERETGRPIGIYPEIKHPTYFLYTGRHVDGAPIRMDLARMLVAELDQHGFTVPHRLYIQCFEPASLVALKRDILPAAGLDIPLVQLIGDVSRRFVNAGGGGFSRPFDVLYHVRQGDDLAAIYGESLAALLVGAGWEAGWGAFASAMGAAAIADYAEAIGPWKLLIFPRRLLERPQDADGDGRAELMQQLTGEQTPLVRLAHAAGLAVHPFTLRPEECFLALNPDGSPQSFMEELDALLAAGVDGLFCDDPAAARAALKRRQRSVRAD